MARNLEVLVHTGILHFCTSGLEAAQNVRVDTARGEDNDQQNLSEMIQEAQLMLTTGSTRL